MRAWLWVIVMGLGAVVMWWSSTALQVGAQGGLIDAAHPSVRNWTPPGEMWRAAAATTQE